MLKSLKFDGIIKKWAGLAREERVDAAALAACAAAYFLLAARRLTVPAVGFDEAIYVPQALFLLTGNPDLMARVAHSSIAGLPLMATHYVGCPISYLLAPLIALFGLSLQLVRLTAIAMAMAAAAVLLRLVRALFPRVPLWAPALLLGLNSVFLMTSRQGLYVDASIHWLLLSVVLWSLWRWSVAGVRRDALICFFAIGFGVYSKIIFIWFLFPAAIWVARSRKVSRGFALLCAASFLAGALPLLVYNAVSGGQTIADILHAVHSVGLDPGTAPNTSILHNIAGRLDDLLKLFAGDFLFPPFAAKYDLTYIQGLAELTLFFTGFFIFREKKQRLAFAAAALFSGLFLLGSIFTVSIRDPYHLIPVFPLLLVLVGVALARLVPDRRMLLALLLVLQLPGLIQYRRYLRHAARQDVGVNEAGALAALSRSLLARGITRPFVLDWGLASPLLVESGGRIVSRELWDTHEEGLSALPDGAVAVCYTRVDVVHPSRMGCARLYADRRFSARVLESIASAAGHPWYTIAQVSRADGPDRPRP